MQLVPAEVEDFDDRCIILIEFFGAFQFRKSCSKSCKADAWSCRALAKVAGRMHGVACHMKRQFFLVEKEC